MRTLNRDLSDKVTAMQRSWEKWPRKGLKAQISLLCSWNKLKSVFVEGKGQGEQARGRGSVRFTHTCRLGKERGFIAHPGESC